MDDWKNEFCLKRREAHSLAFESEYVLDLDSLVEIDVVYLSRSMILYVVVYKHVTKRDITN